MSNILDFNKGGLESLTEDVTFVVYCAVCEGESFTPWVYRDELYFVCSDEGCGEMYTAEDFLEE